MRQLTREVTLGTWRFEVTKMTPATASWIFNLLCANGMLNAQHSQSQASPEAEAALVALTPEKRAAGAVETFWLLCGVSLPEDKYKRVQQCALSVCRVLDTSGNPSAVVMQDGRFTSQDLEADAPIINKLIAEALVFSVSPFFIEVASIATTPTDQPSNPPNQ